MSESQFLSLIENINSSYKAFLISLDNHTYNYVPVLNLVMDEEPGVLARKSKQFPWPHNTANSMSCHYVQTCQMYYFTISRFLDFLMVQNVNIPYKSQGPVR